MLFVSAKEILYIARIYSSTTKCLNGDVEEVHTLEAELSML